MRSLRAVARLTSVTTAATALTVVAFAQPASACFASIERVSGGGGASYYPTISGDGLTIAYSTFGANFQTVLYDVRTKTSRLAVLDADGNVPDGNAEIPGLSANGRYLSFDSWAPNLVPGLDDPTSLVYVRDLETGTNEVVSLTASGQQPNGFSAESRISATGRFVLYQSTADDLPGGKVGIFLHDRDLDVTYGVGLGAANAFPGSVSADGRYVTFRSDETGERDVYLRDVQTGELVALGEGAGGGVSAEDPVVTADGRYVVFALQHSWSGASSLYRYSIADETYTELGTGTVMAGMSWFGNVDVSANGRYVSFTARRGTSAYQVFVHDVVSDTVTAMTPAYADNTVLDTAISDSGRRVVFESSASNVACADDDYTTDILTDKVSNGIRLEQTYGACGTVFAVCDSDTQVDPVNTATGNFTHGETDAVVDQVGGPLVVSRHYNSLDVSTPADLGPGWTRSYAEHLVVSGDRVVLHADDGQQLGFTVDGTTITPDRGVRATLSSAPGGGWTVVDRLERTHAFDAAGRLTSLRDGNGEGVTLAYDGAGRLDTVTGAAGTLTYAHDGAGRLTQVTLPGGRYVTYAYHPDGRLASVVDVRGKTTSYGYTDGRLTTIVDPNGDTVITNTYAPGTGRVVTQVDGEGHASAFAYDDEAGTTTFTDAAGKDWVDTYDGNMLLSRADPYGHESHYGYDSAGNRTSIVDATGRETTFTYDADGNLLTMTEPAVGGVHPVTTFTYDAAGRPLTVTDPTGRTTTTAYDAAGNVVSVTANDTGTSVLTRDARGLVTSVKDPMNRSVWFTYDSAGRLLTATTPTGTTTHTYDSHGRLATVTDPLEHTTTYAHDAADRMTSVTTPLGRETTFAYDDAGRLVTVTDPLDHVTRLEYTTYGERAKVTRPDGTTFTTTYDPRGLVATRTDGRGKTTTYGYDDASRLTSVTAPDGGVTTRTYDDQGRVVSTTDPEGGRTTYTYDAAGRLATTVSPRGNVTGADPAAFTTTFTYDLAGRLTTAAGPLGTSMRYGYDAAGRLAAVTDALNRVRGTEYDLSGQITALVDPAGRKTRFGYDGSGRRTTVTNPLNKTTTFAYDAADRLVSVTTPLGRRTTFGYDADGRRTSGTTPRGNAAGANAALYTSTFAWDDASRLTSATDALGRTTAFTHDARGRVLTRTDANQHTTGYAYDGEGNLLTITAPDLTETAYTYDAAGRVLTRTDANLHTTTYTYDLAGRVTSDTTPLGRKTTRTYDANGNLATVKSPAGQVTRYVHDAADRLTGVDYPAEQPVGVGPFNELTGLTATVSTPDVALTYDVASQLKSVSAGDAAQVYAYDPIGRVMSVTRDGGTIQYGYDAAGQPRWITYPDGSIDTYTYDADGLVSALDTPHGSFAYGYDADGHLTSRKTPVGTGGHLAETRAYDRVGRLTDVTTTLTATGTVVDRTQRTYDPVGNVATETTLGGTARYTYDALDRLLSVCWVAGCGAGLPGSDSAIAYTYDAVGNRLSQTRESGTTTYAYDADDQLTGATSPLGTTTYAYDADGNQIRAGGRAMAYDHAGRLALVDDAGRTTSYAYDGSGQLVRRAHGVVANGAITEQTVHRLVHDPMSAVPLLRSETVTGTGAVTRRYSSGPGGYQQITANGTATVDLTLGPNGTVTGLVSSLGVPLGGYGYTPFGEARTGTQAGAPQTPAAPATNPLRFIGSYLDPATGRYAMGARSYDAGTGRFAQRDPLPPVANQRGESTYLYGSANPGILSDPTGLRAEPDRWQVGQMPSGCPVYDPPDLEEMYACEEIIQRKWERYVDAVSSLAVMVRMQSENLYAYQHPALSVGEIYAIGGKVVGAAAVLTAAVTAAIWTSGASIPAGLTSASFILGGTAVGLSALNATFTCTREGWGPECGGAVALATVDLLLFGAGAVADAASEAFNAATVGRHLSRVERLAIAQEASALSMLAPAGELVREAGEDLSEHFLPGVELEEAVLALDAPDPDLALLSGTAVARALQLDLAWQAIRDMQVTITQNMVPAPPMPGW